MKNKYSVKVSWSIQDNCFVAVCSEFPNLSAFGKTRSQAFLEAEKVIESFVDILNEDGVELPAPEFVSCDNYSGQVRLRMPKSLHRELAKNAEREGVSLNTLMVNVLSKKSGAEESARDILKAVNKIIDDQNENFGTLIRKIRQSDNIAPNRINPSSLIWGEDSGITKQLQ